MLTLFDPIYRLLLNFEHFDVCKSLTFRKFRYREERGILRSRQELSTSYLISKIGVDTPEKFHILCLSIRGHAASVHFDFPLHVSSFNPVDCILLGARLGRNLPVPSFPEDNAASLQWRELIVSSIGSFLTIRRSNRQTAKTLNRRKTLWLDHHLRASYGHLCDAMRCGSYGFDAMRCDASIAPKVITGVLSWTCVNQVF